MTPGPARVFDRRQLLHTAGAALTVGTAVFLSGCSTIGDVVRDAPKPQPRRADNVDQSLLESARADQQELLALCIAVRRANTSLTHALDPVIEHHRTQVDALGSDSGSATTKPSRRVPHAKRRALEVVVDAERTTAHARAQDAADAASGDLARVFAAISASCSQHVAELRAALPHKRGHQ